MTNNSIIKVNNVISQSIYEKILCELYSFTSSWKISFPDGSIKIIPRKTCYEVTDIHCIAYKFHHNFISDRLCFPRISLHYQSPLFISAQTGLGKTSFIFKILYPYLHKHGRKLLIIVSRSTLKTKVKYDAIDAAGTEQRKELQPYGIEKEHHFGDIDVFSYQDISIEPTSAIHKQTLQAFVQSYGAVVFDECHYFTADADFNSSTEYTLNYLINLACKNEIPRIYMTGTPDVVFDSILERETNLPKYFSKMQFFHFKRDYSYIHLSTFKDNREHTELLQKVEQSEGTTWIIFVQSKENGYSLASKINQLNKTTIFLTSETIHEKERDADINTFISNLTDKEILKCDVLITTKCLDVGVTIKNKNVTIVNYLTDKIDFLQSIGRKRISRGECVNLLIPEYTSENVRHWLNQLNRKLDDINTNLKYHPFGTLANSGSNILNPVYIEKGRYNYNQLTIRKLHFQKAQLSQILSEIESSEEPDSIVIAKHFASWMEKCYYNPCINNNDNNAREQQIKAVIETYLNTRMDIQVFNEMTDKLKEFDPRTDQRNSRKNFSTQTVNRIFKSLGYMLKHSKDNDKDIYQITHIPSKSKEDN